MARLELEFDMARFRRGVLRMGKGYKAMRETLRVAGFSETVNARRKKQKGEKRKPVHGKDISWFFRTKRGKWVYEMEGADFEKIHEEMNEAFEKAMHDAFETERPQVADVKRLLLIAAQEWAMAVQDRIESGYLGTNTAVVREKKENLAKSGHITSEYGVPAPAGIMTGRWIEGIRGRWKQGRVIESGSFEVL